MSANNDESKEPVKPSFSMPSAQTQNRIAVLNFFKEEADNWMFKLEFLDYQAKLAKAKYDAAIANGFNEVQALTMSTQNWSI